MTKDASSQKFIGKNNAPRVQIEYDVELYGSQKKVELPFVTGVMSDLSGHRKHPLPAVEERKFLTFDQDNFDTRMKAIKPGLKFYVDNALTDEGGLLDIELEFTSMDDFSPGAVARRIPQMNTLLQARARLAELMTYMDGKTSAEEMVKQLLEKPELLQRLASNTQRKAAEQDQENHARPTEGER